MRASHVYWIVSVLTLACGPRLPEATTYGVVPQIESHPVRWQVAGIYPADGAQITQANVVAVRLKGDAYGVSVRLRMAAADLEIACAMDTDVETTVESTEVYTRYRCPIDAFMLFDGWNEFEIRLADGEYMQSYLRSFYYNEQPVHLTGVWDGASQVQWATDPGVRVYLRINQVRLAMGSGSGQATLDAGLLPSEASFALEAWRHDGKHSEVTFR